MGRHLLVAVLLLALILVGAAAALSPGFRSDVAWVGGDAAGILSEGGSDVSPWDDAIQTPDGGKVGVVETDVLNVRTRPSLDTPVIDGVFDGHLVTVYESIDGDEVDGDSTWYRIGDQQYLTAAFVEPFEPREPDRTFDGRWMDVDLSEHYAVAYEGDTPVHAAILLTGRAGWDTPEGKFEITRRVESETMDAATLGISENAPNYYYLEDVPYTQYFAEGGFAIHGNDWSPPEAFGGTGSHGCINMPVEDARFFWDFLRVGSPVLIRS